MSLKAGRVGVNPADVDPISGHISAEASEGYTKSEADDKFLSKSDASLTYESKSEASTAHNLLQPKTLAVPISMLDGSKLTVEDALNGLNNNVKVYSTAEMDNTATWSSLLTALIGVIGQNYLSIIETACRNYKKIYLILESGGSSKTLRILNFASVRSSFASFNFNSSEGLYYIELGSTLLAKIYKWSTTGTDILSDFPYYTGTVPSDYTAKLSLVISN